MKAIIIKNELHDKLFMLKILKKKTTINEVVEHLVHLERNNEPQLKQFQLTKFVLSNDGKIKKLILPVLFFMMLFISPVIAGAYYETPSDHILGYEINGKTLIVHTSIGDASVKIDSNDIPNDWWRRLQTWVRKNGKAYKFGYGDDPISPVTRNITIWFEFEADFTVDKFFPCNTIEEQIGEYRKNITSCDWIIQKRNYTIDFNDLEDAGHILWKDNNKLYVNLSLVEGKPIYLDPAVYILDFCYIYGSGNTLQTVYDDISNNSVFYYDSAKREGWAMCTVFIGADSDLMIKNETLHLNVTSNFQYNINNQGTLKINESSNITTDREISTYKYGFANSVYSILDIDNSTIEWCGNRPTGSYELRGLNIESSNTTITNSKLSNNKNHINLYYLSDNIFIENNTFDGGGSNVRAIYIHGDENANTYIQNLTIKNNVFKNMDWGIYQESGNGTQIINNSFYDLGATSIYLGFIYDVSMKKKYSFDSYVENNSINGDNDLTRVGIQVNGFGNIFRENTIINIEGADCSREGLTQDYAYYIDFMNNTSIIHDSISYIGGDCLGVGGQEKGYGIYIVDGYNSEINNTSIYEIGGTRTGYGMFIDSLNDSLINNLSLNQVTFLGLLFSGNNVEFNNLYIFSTDSSAYLYGNNNTFLNSNLFSIGDFGALISTSDTYYNNFRITFIGAGHDYIFWLTRGNNWFIDCNFSTGLVCLDCEYDMQNTNSTTTFINTTFGSMSIGQGENSSFLLDLRHWLDIRALYYSIPVNDMNVSMWNVTNELQFSEYTGSDGYIARKNQTQYIRNDTTIFYANNYTINATKNHCTDFIGFLNLTGNTLFNITTVCEPIDRMRVFFKQDEWYDHIPFMRELLESLNIIERRFSNAR